MKVLLSETNQTIIFIEIRKDLPARGRVQVTDSQAECKEVKHYRDLNELTIWSVDELAKHDAAIERQASQASVDTAAVEVPKERTPTQPMTPVPETKPVSAPEPEKPTPAPTPVSEPVKPASDPAPAAKLTYEDTKKKK